MPPLELGVDTTEPSSALYVGIALIVAGIVLAIFAILGFRHARRTAATPTAEVT